MCGLLTESNLSCSLALVFSGNINPAHPNTIGCIDSVCDVTEVTRGKRERGESECERVTG